MQAITIIPINHIANRYQAICGAEVYGTQDIITRHPIARPNERQKNYRTCLACWEGYQA